LVGILLGGCLTVKN